MRNHLNLNLIQKVFVTNLPYYMAKIVVLYEYEDHLDYSI